MSGKTVTMSIRIIFGQEAGRRSDDDAPRRQVYGLYHIAHDRQKDLALALPDDVHIIGRPAQYVRQRAKYLSLGSDDLTAEQVMDIKLVGWQPHRILRADLHTMVAQRLRLLNRDDPADLQQNLSLMGPDALHFRQASVPPGVTQKDLFETRETVWEIGLQTDFNLTGKSEGSDDLPDRQTPLCIYHGGSRRTTR